MTRYSYQGISRIKVFFSKLSGLLGITFSTIVAIFTFVGIRFVPTANGSVTILNSPKVTLICFALWWLIFGWSVSLVLINLLPTLWVNENGLFISAYLFLKIQIPWSSIIDIGAGNPPFGYILVRTRKITIFHRIYGWLYSRTLHPSFLIGKGIKDRDELISEISQRIKTQT